MNRTQKVITGAALLSFVLPAISIYQPTPASAADFSDAAFKRTWTRTDKLVADGTIKRSYYWGPAPGESLMEPYAQGTGGMRRVQYFDKSRMEINDPSADPTKAFYVTNGLLTVELVSGKMQVGDSQYEDRKPADIPLASDVDDANAPTYASFSALANSPLGDHPATNLTGQTVTDRVDKAGKVTKNAEMGSYGAKYAFYNTETKHNIASQIWDFLNLSGPVLGTDGKQTTGRLSDPWFYTTGYAISEPYWANVKIQGKQTDVLIQLFQRRVVTYVPNAPQGFQVQMGNIGAHYYDWRYKSTGQQPVMFAQYNLEPSTVIPSVKPYTVAKGLTNVSNASDFQITPATRALVEKYGFGAQFPSGQAYKQFYQLYEEGRYADSPVFVTTDSILHVYHLMFDKLLRSTETNYLIADLNKMTAALMSDSLAQYNAVKGTAVETAARRNVAFFAVASKLLDPSAQVPAFVQTEVSADLAQINAHSGLAQSAVMGIGGAEFIEDFSQYVPRGHYTRSPELMKYFQAMMWYGRLTFRLKEADETRSALLITEAMLSDKTAAGNWAKIYEPTSFFVGGSDDLTYNDYAPLLAQAFGNTTDPKALADDAGMAKFLDLSKALAAPRINSMFVYITEDKEQVTKGLRMMGQRFTLDEYVLGQLIWRNVGNPDLGQPETTRRWMPKALDVPAAFGSQEAVSILGQIGETKYMSYTKQLTKVQGQIASLADSQWTENVYWSWLYAFRPLLVPKAANSGYPSFMTNQAWTRKDLNTVLGSYTELKHDTILYAKQVMAEMGGGPPNIIKGYVEPEPEFYARVAALVGMTRDGLVSRGLLEQTKDPTVTSDYNNLNQLEQLALDLKHISEKELQNKALSDDEYTLIQYYGGTLEHMTIAASDVDQQNQGRSDINDQDAAVVADIATGGPQLDQTLEEGTGRIMEIYVVAPVGGKLVLARGGIYSQYEFVQPSSNRLTDEAWRQNLDAGKAPPLGDWKIFISK